MNHHAVEPQAARERQRVVVTVHHRLAGAIERCVDKAEYTVDALELGEDRVKERRLGIASPDYLRAERSVAVEHAREPRGPPFSDAE
jgi:hypothetical protein